MRGLLTTLLLMLTLTVGSLLAQALNTQNELILSAPLDKESLARLLSVKNTTNKAVSIEKLVLTGDMAAAFHLSTAITFPLSIPANDSVELAFTFKPLEKAGMHKAILEVYSPAFESGKNDVNLYGLASAGLTPEQEPPLQMILQALGYKINVGTQQNDIGMLAEPMGEEIIVSHFRSASQKAVIIKPLARYSAREDVPFGIFYEDNGQIKYLKTATLSDYYLQHHTLFPRLSSGKTYTPSVEQAFGIFASNAKKAVYTDETLNPEMEHACRIYPLRDRAGNKLENAFILCFEEGDNSDFQDYVFLIENVIPLP
jgi:hypothetical protein